MARDFEGATPESLGRALLRPTALKVIAGAPDRPLVIGDVEIPCYVLEDETRVLSQQGFLDAIGRARKAKGGQGGSMVDKPPAFLAPTNLKPFISSNLSESTTPIRFQSSDGKSGYGYPAVLLPQVCDVYLKARHAGVLLPSQKHIAERAEILVRGLATVGINALIDEATGYQEIREKRALATILEKFIAKEFQPWTKTFPYEFYQQIFRLRDWSGPPSAGSRGPRVIAKYTNDIVYERLAPGVLDELKRLNPKTPHGGRRHKHHQWFTPDFGHPKLKEHLSAVIALMRAASKWSRFQHMLDRAFPKQNTTIPLPLEDQDDHCRS
jgi:hypothetical protein